MCKFCSGDLTSRKECGIGAIAIIIICLVIIGYVSTRETFNIYHKIVVGGSSFAILAAIFLLIGAILENRFLVWIWVAIMIPIAVIITTAYIIKLCREWEIIRVRDKIHIIIGLIIFPCYCAYQVLISVVYALKLKRKRSEVEDRAGVYFVRCL
ncbi:uncharacterized protein LOC27208632 [Drosophila simulans]|uniref:Uncharacterized protein n=1 Tax=Drosophila simulans TaxID=7240 RepID=A0A0J9U6J8_DROSI|nr:uncharacterized protein LOC27208632 [Drosophila simulans]KMY95205.1 uncharacterized protein Dsimw501_GD28788 [Drosophila simulans]